MYWFIRHDVLNGKLPKRRIKYWKIVSAITMPLISVVTVCLNSEKTIERTVKSVKRQSHKNVEHIIKDGGSRDKTIQLAKRMNPGLRVFVKHDNGIYDAMNQGFLHVNGEIVCFLNSDDYLLEENLLSLVAKKFSETDCDFVYGDIVVEDETSRVVRDWKVSKELGTGLLTEQALHPAFFVKIELLKKFNVPFDPDMEPANLKQQLYLINFLNAKGII